MDLIKDMLRRPTSWYFILILLIVGGVGSMNFEDAVLYQNHYCKMVVEGYWPDYDRIYEDECVALGYPTVPTDLHPAGDTTR
jgi:hypothetical protein